MSQFSFKVMGPRSKSRQWKSSSVQLKNYWPEIDGLDQNICYHNALSNLEFLTFWRWLSTLRHFRINSIQSLSSECLQLAVSFSVWGYIFRISRSPNSPSSFKVTGLMSRSQYSGSAESCASLGHSLILLFAEAYTPIDVHPRISNQLQEGFTPWVTPDKGLCPPLDPAGYPRYRLTPARSSWVGVWLQSVTIRTQVFWK